MICKECKAPLEYHYGAHDSQWDGCSHVYFGEEGYIHICGGRKWRSHIEVCKRLFDLAAQYFNEEHQKEYFYKEFNAIDHD